MTRPAAAFTAGRDAKAATAAAVLPLPPEPGDSEAWRRRAARGMAAKYAVQRAAVTWRSAHRAAAASRAAAERVSRDA